MTTWWSLARPATIELVWCIAPERDETRERRKGIVAVVYMNVDLNRMHTPKGSARVNSIVRLWRNLNPFRARHEAKRFFDEDGIGTSVGQIAVPLCWHDTPCSGACMNESELHLSATHETVFVFLMKFTFFFVYLTNLSFKNLWNSPILQRQRLSTSFLYYSRNCHQKFSSKFPHVFRTFAPCGSGTFF